MIGSDIAQFRSATQRHGGMAGRNLFTQEVRDIPLRSESKGLTLDGGEVVPTWAQVGYGGTEPVYACRVVGSRCDCPAALDAWSNKRITAPPDSQTGDSPPRKGRFCLFVP